MMDRFELSQPNNLDYSKDEDEFGTDYYIDISVHMMFHAFVAGWREGVMHCT